MSPVADNPVIVPDRDLEDEKSRGTPRIRCPLGGWSPREEDVWSCSCGHEGTHSIREGCAPPASTSGLRRSAFRARAARRTPIGIRSDLSNDDPNIPVRSPHGSNRQTERDCGKSTRLLTAISPNEAAKLPVPGKWSKKQELGHLVDSACNNHQRIVRAQLEKEPRFPATMETAG